MSTDFVVTAQSKPDVYADNVSVGDATKYTFDFTPWQEANDTITDITWTVEGGQVAVADQVDTDGVTSAVLTFNQYGHSTVSILATTATSKKKIWLRVRAKDQNVYLDDYGMCCL